MTHTSTKNNIPKKTSEHSSKPINTYISTEELHFNKQTELNNIINLCFSSLDRILSQPNKSKFMDIENLCENTMNQVTDLLRKDAYRILKEKD
jgi:hypothetical protein